MNNNLLIFARKCTMVLGIALCPVFAMGQQTDAVTLPFAFDGGSADIARIPGMSQNGIATTDNTSSPKLRFDSKNDYLIVHFDGTAKGLAFMINGNFSGQFDVMESADGNKYTSVQTYYSHTSSTADDELYSIKATSRYIKFVYTNKTSGVVSLGRIRLYTRQFTIGSTGWITYYTEEPFQMPAGTRGVVVTNSQSGEVVLMEKYPAGSNVPGYLPLLINGAPNTTYTYTEPTNTNRPSYLYNYIHGHLIAGPIAAVANTEHYYKLANGADGLGWYWGAADGGRFEMGGFKAYLALPVAARVPSFEYIEEDFEEETDLEAIPAEGKTEKFFENGQIFIRKDGAVYTVTGVRVR